jgi:hypothetical protein
MGPTSGGIEYFPSGISYQGDLTRLRKIRIIPIEERRCSCILKNGQRLILIFLR